MPNTDLLDMLTAWKRRIPELTHRNDKGKAKLAEFMAYVHQYGMTNLEQGKQDLKLQQVADAIYLATFGEQLPYRTFFTVGNTDHLYQAVHVYETIDIDKPHTIDTLCHELLHVHDLFRPHGKRFQAKVDKMVGVANDILKG